VLTVGVDLAADEAKTAVASIHWLAGAARVKNLIVGADDSAVLAAVAAAEKAGVDCPLGWPVPFVEFVAAHQAGQFVAPQDVAGRDWRRQLAFRRTDLAVHDAVDLWPLSVAADRIAHTAMRCAGLLARLANDGQPVDRCGTGVVVEVYPAASLKRWKLPYQRYKGPSNTEPLQRLVDALTAAAPWLVLGEFEAECRRSDHALDAVVAALTGRAAILGQTVGPPERHAMAASTEGWIALPAYPLSALHP
jgi:predicted nuclease with RNAse H fold